MTDAPDPPHAEQILDTKGLLCPLPVLKAQRAMRSLAPGARLTVYATDPASYLDFRHFCETNGHSLEGASEDGTSGVFTYVIRKGV